MKKVLLFNLFFQFLIFALLLFPFFPAYSQCSIPAGSGLTTQYDGRKTAYATLGNGNNVLQGWEATDLWTRCIFNGQEIGDPTPDPKTNKTDLYLQISAGDNVIVDKLTFGNQVTLVICGDLFIGSVSIVEGGETGEDPGDLTGLNKVRIIICPGGSLTIDVLDVQNKVTLEIDGVLNVNTINGSPGSGQATLCIWSPAGTGVIQSVSGGLPTFNNNYGYGQNCLGDDPSDGGITLPIDILAFTPEIKPDRINLLWTTGTEINNDYYTIERSRDLYGWEVLGFVEGAGNSSVPIDYSFTDYRPLDGLAYYRLKQTDFDGAFKYYGPIAAHYDLGMDGLDFKVMKNYSNWVIAVPNDGFYQVEVYNLQGHRLHSERVENTLSIPAPEGAVVIRVTDGFERSASRVVM